MSRPTAPSVPIALDKERRLKFDFNALSEAERVSGKSYLLGGFDTFSAADLRALVWAGLLHEAPELTLEEVGGWLHMGNAAEVMEGVTKALKQANPEPDEGPDPLARKPEAPAG